MSSRHQRDNIMPKVGDKGDKGAKGKRKPTRCSPRKSREVEADDSLGESDGAGQETLLDTQGDNDGDPDRSRQGRPAVEERIAQFFEDWPYFYGISHEDYKNRQRKDSQLAEFAATIGWDGEYYQFYFSHF